MENFEHVSQKYLAIRRTPSLVLIFHERTDFSRKNRAPYNRITTVSIIFHPMNSLVTYCSGKLYFVVQKLNFLTKETFEVMTSNKQEAMKLFVIT